MFHDKCFNVGKNDYALRMLNTFVNLCEKNFDIATISGAIQVREHCTRNLIDEELFCRLCATIPMSMAFIRMENCCNYIFKD